MFNVADLIRFYCSGQPFGAELSSIKENPAKGGASFIYC